MKYTEVKKMRIYNLNDLKTKDSQQKTKADHEAKVKDISELLEETMSYSSINNLVEDVEISHKVSGEGCTYLYLTSRGLEEQALLEHSGPYPRPRESVTNYKYVVDKYEISRKDVLQLKDKLESLS